MIRVENIYKEYGENDSKVVALNNVNIEISKGEFVSIIGPSGSGKSTLLHILSGIDIPTSGKVYINNKDIYQLREKEISAFRRRNFGFIFQAFNLIPTLTVEENIKMPIFLDKKQVDEKYFQELIEILGLKDRIKHMPHELSGGQQQRVAIARALISKPDIVFADEPTGNLDTKTGDFVIKLLSNTIKEYGTTLVIITHDPKVASVGDRQLSIVDGNLMEVAFK